MRQGIRAKHLLGDSWFGNKANIKTSIELKLTAIFMMKRGKMAYRYRGHNYTVKELYVLVKRKMIAPKGQRFRTFALTVEINVATKGKMTHWTPVNLVFSQPHGAPHDNWALLLCTDVAYDSTRILELYALRWGIEVYFKEVKQGMAWMKEQSGRYVVHYASIHLASIRYMLIFSMMLDSGQLKFGEMKNRVTGAMEQLGFASMLWELFRALLHGVLDQFEHELGCSVLKKIKASIDATIEGFLFRALQIDPDSLDTQRKLEQIQAA